MKKQATIFLGTTTGAGPAPKGLPVSVEVELTDDINTTAPYLDIDLQPALHVRCVSFSGTIGGEIGYHSGGQNADSIKAEFPDDPDVLRLLAIWNRYHLGTMQAGTRRQREAIEAHEAAYPDWEYTYDGALQVLAVAGLQPDRKTPGPKFNDAIARIWNGYSYGSSWLVENLPDDVFREVLRIVERGDLAMRTPGWLERAEKDGRIAYTVREVIENPNMTDMLEGSKHFKFRIRRGDSKRVYLTAFYSVAREYTPALRDVLTCLLQDAASASESFEDFCGNCGYDTGSRKAEGVYNLIRKQTDGLKAILGHEFAALRDGEIQL